MSIKNKNIKVLYVGRRGLTNLDVSNNINLEVLYCYNNQLTNLDVSKNKNLEWLSCENNNIKMLDLRNCKKLTKDNVICDSGVVLIWTDKEYEKYMQAQVAHNNIEKPPEVITQNNQTYNLNIFQYQNNFVSAEFRINLGDAAIQLKDEDAKAILDYTLSLVKNYISK